MADGEDIKVTARQVIELYHQNTRSTATPFDIWQSGDAILLRVDEVETESRESIAELESEIEPIETNITEIQQVLAKVIFGLNEQNINFSDEQINEFRNKYLI